MDGIESGVSRNNAVFFLRGGGVVVLRFSG
jgi:hypothetical protein